MRALVRRDAYASDVLAVVAPTTVAPRTPIVIRVVIDPLTDSSGADRHEPKPNVAITPVTRPAGAAPSSNPPAPLGFALEGAALALLATSLSTGALALSEKKRMNDSCENQPNGCTDAALNAAARGDTLATTSTVTMVGALTAAAAGVVLLLLNPSAKPRAVSVTSAGFAARF